MKLLSIGLALVLLLCSSIARAGFGYICIQPDDTVFTTLPAVDWSPRYGELKNEYRGNDLFKPKPASRGVLSFSPIPALEIVLEVDDYEGEVVFDGVRFLQADGKLYTWVSMTGTKSSGVAHRIVRTLQLNGKEVARSRPLSVDVRKNLSSCNS